MDASSSAAIRRPARLHEKGMSDEQAICTSVLNGCQRGGGGRCDSRGDVFQGSASARPAPAMGRRPATYTQTFDDDFCGNVELNQGGQTIMAQEFTLETESNVVVYFMFQFGFRTPRQEGLMSFGLDSASTNKE